MLAVDQFEEAFTVCRDEAERTAFLDALVELAEDRDRSVQVVVAVRADFYGHCAMHDRLARLAGANQVLVGPMRRDELRRAIEEPARRVGLQVEPSLTDALIADVLDQPGALPLLSAALVEQWREREGRVLRRAAYDRTGGVRGAVGRLAEQTYSGLSEPERVAARAILLRLADAGEHEAAFVRRRMPLDELDRDEHTAAALAALVDSRLVTADDETLEVAHEALLREWPRLRGWLEEDAEGRRLHQHLMNAARDWQAAGRDSGELYRGARLASTLDWVAGHERDLNELEREFLAESRAEAEHEAEHQRRTNRRLRALLGGLAALLALAVVAGVVALNQRGEARDTARTADAQRLGVEALNQERLDQALLTASAAVALDESPATQSNLLSVLQRNPATLGAVDHDFGIFGAAISPDGKLMAIGDDIGNVVVYDAATRQPLGQPYRIETGIIQNVRFSPDGETLAVSFMDRSVPELSAVFDLIDPRSRERRLRRAAAPVPRARALRLRRRRVPAERPRPARAAGARRLAKRPGGADVSRRRQDRSAEGSAAGGPTRGLLLRDRDCRQPASVRHEPARQPDLGARPGGAQRGALLAGRGLRRGGQPRRADLRSGLRERGCATARSRHRPDPSAQGRTRWPRSSGCASRPTDGRS